MATSPQDKKITLNLDTVEKEKVYEPFVFSIGTQTITLTDPQDLDFQVLMAIEHPSQFFRHCMSAEDREAFRKAAIPGWKFKALMDAYNRHYGLDDLPNGAGSRTL